jgi:3-dehydroquinate synthase
MMNPTTKLLKVNLGDRSYPIRIGRHLDSDLSQFVTELIAEGRKGVAVIDQNFLEAQPGFAEAVFNQLPYLTIESGEASKSVDQIARVWNFLASSKVDRSGFLLAVGGGVVGDMAGFAAASFLRGISFHQVPTTLLAMVDSSVGGKTGINLEEGKNLVGAFHQPETVWADLKLLNTLPPREFSAGMAEVVKYGMLGDKDLFHLIANQEKPFSPTSDDLPELIHRCCEIKARIVQEDERETSILGKGRALLNLGHTFGHAIEKVAGYGSYLHGEAVAIGLVCALRLSHYLGHCPETKEEGLINLLASYHLPTRLRIPLKCEDLVKAMHSDKKVDRGVLRFVVMKEVGDSFCTNEVSEDSIARIWASVDAL